MQIMLVFEIQIFVHQIQLVDFWFNISYSVDISLEKYFNQIQFDACLTANHVKKGSPTAREHKSIDRPLGETWSKSFSVQSHTRSSMIESPSLSLACSASHVSCKKE